MARPTTKPVHDDLVIELDNPNADTENFESQEKTGNMTVPAKPKTKLNVKNKLTSTWLKLLSLPPQELVAELKVNHIKEKRTCVIILIPLLSFI